jgi:hypothetical protein
MREKRGKFEEGPRSICTGGISLSEIDANVFAQFARNANIGRRG